MLSLSPFATKSPERDSPAFSTMIVGLEYRSDEIGELSRMCVIAEVRREMVRRSPILDCGNEITGAPNVTHRNGN